MLFLFIHCFLLFLCLCYSFLTCQFTVWRRYSIEGFARSANFHVYLVSEGSSSAVIVQYVWKTTTTFDFSSLFSLLKRVGLFVYRGRTRGGVPPVHAAVPRGAAPRGAPPSRTPSARGRGVQRARGAPPTAGYRPAPPIVQDTYGEYVSRWKLHRNAFRSQHEGDYIIQLKKKEQLNNESITQIIKLTATPNIHSSKPSNQKICWFCQFVLNHWTYRRFCWVSRLKTSSWPLDTFLPWSVITDAFRRWIEVSPVTKVVPIHPVTLCFLNLFFSLSGRKKHRNLLGQERFLITCVPTVGITSRSNDASLNDCGPIAAISAKQEVVCPVWSEGWWMSF